jgi:hypothetical protein
MKSKLTKIRKILGEKAKSIINQNGLYSSFNLFYENTKSKTKNSDFPEQVEKIANGFHDFISKRKVGLFPQGNHEIGEFYRFLLTFDHVLNNLTRSEEKSYLINQFKSKSQDQECLIKLRGFYYELKILSKLLIDGFIIEKLPEADVVNYYKCSKPDGIVSKNGKLFQVECKTFSYNIGHPIIADSAEKFIHLLVKDYIYNIICPKDSYCSINLIFNKKLVNSLPKNSNEDCYTPSTLLDKLKIDYNSKSKDLIINTSKSDKVIAKNKINDIESSYSCRFDYIPPNSPNNIIHQLSLTSKACNTLAEKQYEIINKVIDSNRIDQYPLICCFEFYDLLDSEETRQLIGTMFHKHYDKKIWVIVSDRAEKENIPWHNEVIHGRKPIMEFKTKAISNFLIS